MWGNLSHFFLMFAWEKSRKGIILVCLGFHNKISQTGCLKQQKLSLSQSMIKMLAKSVSGEDSSWLADGHLLTVSTQALSSVVCRDSGREREISSSSFFF